MSDYSIITSDIPLVLTQGARDIAGGEHGDAPGEALPRAEKPALTRLD